MGPMEETARSRAETAHVAVSTLESRGQKAARKLEEAEAACLSAHRDGAPQARISRLTIDAAVAAVEVKCVAKLLNGAREMANSADKEAADEARRAALARADKHGAQARELADKALTAIAALRALVVSWRDEDAAERQAKTSAGMVTSARDWV